MSSEYKQPVWPRPPKPSPRLKVVLDYFDYLSKWDLETLSQLSTSHFTQVTLPASLHIPARSKKEDIEILHQFRDSLKGAHLEIIIYDVNESKGKIWVHLMMKTIGAECFFLFKFGEGSDENLIINVTEFVDSKVFAGSSDSSSGHSDTGSGSSAKQPETPVEALSSSVRNCIKATGRCFVDILLFGPRCLKYVIKTGTEQQNGAAQPRKA